MPNYDPLPQKQILSYQVRGPELEAIVSVLRLQPVYSLPLSELTRKFVPQTSGNQAQKTELLREALNFLRAIEFIHQKTEPDQSITYDLANCVKTKEPFALAFLRRMHEFQDDRRAFRLITDVVIKENLMFGPRRYVVALLEKHYPGSYSWNGEKYRAWQQICDFLGVVRSVKTSQGDTLFSPNPQLIRTLISSYTHSREVSAGGFLQYVHDNFFSCLTAKGEIHRGLMRTLTGMENLGQLKFAMRSDAPNSVMLEKRRVAYLELV
jgi:hypothetical protein